MVYLLSQSNSLEVFLGWGNNKWISHARISDPHDLEPSDGKEEEGSNGAGMFFFYKNVIIYQTLTFTTPVYVKHVCIHLCM